MAGLNYRKQPELGHQGVDLLVFRVMLSVSS